MSAEAITAFFSGIGAVLSALVSLHLARRHAEKECQKRIEQIRQAIHEGYEMRHE